MQSCLLQLLRRGKCLNFFPQLHNRTTRVGFEPQQPTSSILRFYLFGHAAVYQFSTEQQTNVRNHQLILALKVYLSLKSLMNKAVKQHIHVKLYLQLQFNQNFVFIQNILAYNKIGTFSKLFFLP